MAETIAIVVSKDRGSDPARDALQSAIVRHLEKRPDLDVTVIPHLYDLAPDGPAMRFLRSLSGDVVLLSWLYPRSAYWVLDAHGVRGRLGRTSSFNADEWIEPPASRRAKRKTPDRTLWCLDLRKHELPEIHLTEIDAILAGVRPAAELPAAGADAAATVVDEPVRNRWYPVVDLERCDNCQECLNFCLFGVFGLDAGESVVIEQPDACRAGCPACSRICPSGAILFPQHNDPAIAGGRPADPSGLKLDLSQLFGGATAAELAAAERGRAVEQSRAESDAPSAPSPSAAHGDGTDRKASDQLDALVDRLDQLDL